MENIKMIITDLDETLLYSDKSISDYTISVLEKCRAKGIKIVFATARSIKAASEMLKRFKPDIFIGYGGALVLAGENVIYRFDIPADISSKLINDCLKEPDIKHILATNEVVSYTNQIDPNNKIFSHYQEFDFSSDDSIRYLKISIISSNDDLVRKIASDYPMLDFLRYKGEDFYRFANPNAVKWNAIKAVSDFYNISTDAFVAFGDDKNDLEMIKNCGIGVAVENALDEVKDVAKYICGANNNDGVAKWLETHILNQ
jgi:Cof subfamily protein (haloacid dehalogenase superfamily)